LILARLTKKIPVKTPHNLALGLLIFLLSSSSSTTVMSPQTIAQSNNRFAFHLYEEIAKTENGNIFFSPNSISTAFAMTYAGTAGTTEKSMGKVLQFGRNTPSFHQAYGAYLQQLDENAKGAIKLRIANRLWGEKTYSFEDEFLRLTDDAYDAPLEKVNFIEKPDAQRQAINRWIEAKTENKIKKLLTPGAITTDTRLVLANAIYFKGDWLYQFKEKNTQDQKFFLADGSHFQTPFMKNRGGLPYFENDLYKMVRLPYKGDKHSMVVVLPHQTKDLKQVEEQMATATFEPLFYEYRPEVILELPKFKLDKPLALNAPLASMGMAEAFQTGANFSKMTPTNDLWISAALHKAFIEIDEKGTEAAAATVIIMTIESTSNRKPPKPMEFIADHPFLFYIIDHETRSILFMGRIMKPKIAA
jgi:serpin B